MNLQTLKKRLTLCFWIWVGIESGYQIYLWKWWVHKGVYQWQQYVVERNQKELQQLQDYFQTHPKPSYSYQEGPKEGRLNPLEELPPPIQKAIRHLRTDLLGGVPLPFGCNGEMFRVNYQKVDRTKYVIHVDAGVTFKQNWNGYNFGVTLTNAGPSYTSRMTEIYPSVFVSEREQYNLPYRAPFFVFSYNCNRYDLLIWKFFRSFEIR